MKAVAAIVVVFLVQCTDVRAESNPWILHDVAKDITEYFADSCFFGTNSISVILHNSRYPQGKKLEMEECCYHIDSSLPIVFIVHGFVSSANVTSFQTLASELLQKNNTVFAVDWSQGACTKGLPIIKFIEYPDAVHNTHEIGQLMANYTIALTKQCGIPMENIRYIGHSLGAHVCGFAAKNVQNWTCEMIPLILALDPAAILFEGRKCEERVCKSDAKRLVVASTSSLGISEPIGHLNLQFTNGIVQPGCDILDISCSHNKAIEYAIEVVQGNCRFLGVPWNKRELRGLFLRTPDYPTRETKDCVVVSSNILKTGNPIEGNYYVFPKCANETFNCKQ